MRSNASGGVESFLINNQSGQVEKYSIFNFDRGDIVDLMLFTSNTLVNKGDTIASFSSSRFSETLIEVNLTLAELKGELNVLESGEKKEVVAEMKSRLSVAQKRLETQQKIYSRAENLLERQIISQEEFDIIEGQLELYRAETQVAKDALTVVQSGSKEEEINAVLMQINSAEKYAERLKGKIGRSEVISPIDGKIQTYANNDTLLVINSLNELVLTLPIPASQLNNFEIGNQVTIDTKYSEITLTVKTINENIFYYNREPYLKIVTGSFVSEDKIPINSVLNCMVENGDVDLITYLKNVIN